MLGSGSCWAAVLLLLLAVGAAAAANASLPDGLDSKPLLEQLLARKAFLREHLKSSEWRKHVQQQFDKRSSDKQGVLIVAGGRDMFANAAITLTVLRRHLRSSVPVEIVHYGPKELPSPDLLAYIASFNSSSSSSSDSNGSILAPVYVTDALAAAPPEAAAPHHRKLPEGFRSFPAKVYALTHVTRFQQVLLLDADSMPLVDPQLLFKVPLFQRAGSLFWPDLWYNAWVNDTIYTLVGDMAQAPWVGQKHHRLVDSGQMLLDRQRHAEVLEYLWLLNSHHEWVYKHMHGDKDTFLLAFSMAGQRDMFAQVPCFARDAMRDIPSHKHKFHHLGMVQSIPPAALGAAMRATAAAGGGGGGDSSSSSSRGAETKMRQLLQVEGTALSNRQGWEGGLVDAASSSSSSSRGRSVLAAALDSSSSSGIVPASNNKVAVGNRLLAAAAAATHSVLHQISHTYSSTTEAFLGLVSSSSSSSRQWQQQQWSSSSGSSRRLLQPAAELEEGAEVAAREGLLLPDGPALPPSAEEQQQQQQQQQPGEGGHVVRPKLVGLTAALQTQPAAAAAAAAGVDGSGSADGARGEDGMAMNMDTGMEDPLADPQGLPTAAEEEDKGSYDEGPGDMGAKSAPAKATAAGSARAAAGGPAASSSDAAARTDATASTAGAAAAAAVEMGPKGPPKRPQLKHVGVPVFFHRTSFNSKFFPDCLNADKIKTHYCEVEWVSVPLSNEQAGHSLKPHMFAWDESQIDTSFYSTRCSRNATHRSGSAGLLRNRAAARHLARYSSSSSSSSGAPRRPLQDYTVAAEPAEADTGGGAAAGGGGHGRHQQQQQQQQHGRHGRRRRQRPVVARFGLPPEVLCEALPVGEDVMPIPVVPVALFPYMQGVLGASYEAFGVVRGKAGV